MTEKEIARLKELREKDKLSEKEYDQWQYLEKKQETAAKIRTLSAEKPCSNCDQNDTCNIPCEAYLRWYNESLALIRKLVGL